MQLPSCCLVQVGRFLVSVRQTESWQIVLPPIYFRATSSCRGSVLILPVERLTRRILPMYPFDIGFTLIKCRASSIITCSVPYQVSKHLPAYATAVGPHHRLTWAGVGYELDGCSENLKLA